MRKLILLFIALCCWSNVVDAQNVNIPDANFKAALVADLSINTNGDGEIQVSEATAFTGAVYVLYDNISNLAGIEYFTAITHLNCSHNHLTSLDVSACTALRHLDCQYNQLINLNISNTALQYLNCRVNQLTNLDISTNTALTHLECQINNITSLNLSNNANLDYLDCAGNNLTNLDLSSNTVLTYLDCIASHLINLNVSSCTILINLRCSYNELTNLDVSANTALNYLYCPANQLTNLDVSTNTALIGLACSDNQLTNLDISSNNTLTNLNCIRNQLTNLDVSGNTALTSLSCDENNLTNLDVSSCTNLGQLYCGLNQLTNLDVSSCTNLGQLNCGYNQLTNLDVSTNVVLGYLECAGNPNLCLSFLPVNLSYLSTDAPCLPNIPINLVTSLPLCSSLSINPCFEYPSITGDVYIDMNNNSIKDTMDFDAPYQVVSSGVFATATDVSGNYNLIIDTSVTDNISIPSIVFNNNYFTLSPTSIPIITINTPAQTFPNNNFRLIPTGTQSDAEAHLIGGIYRPGFNTTIAFVCKNEGNTIIDPAITVAIDPNLTVLSSSVVPDGGGAVSNNMTFSSTGLAPFGQTTIYVDVFTPISLALGSPISNTVSIAITNEVTPANNTFTENTTVIGSYDPNDKTADIDYITPTEIAVGKEINYTIRFQNTGTFPADFVIVTDTLDNDLNASTLELISTSHTLSKMTIATDITHPNQPNVVKWYFYNINLPDSSSNEAESHGYIRFSIRPKTGLPLGTLIENMAGIVFDFNTPVLTNTWVIPVSLGSNIVVAETGELNYNIYPNPVEDMLFIESKNSDEYSISLLSINGQVIYTAEGKTELTELDMRDLQDGLYLLQIIDKHGIYTQKFLKI